MAKPNTKHREQNLRRLIEVKTRNLSKAPSGSLRISPIRGNTRYYHVTEGERSGGTYLGKKDQELARRLAQKAYDLQVVRRAEQELRAWEQLAKYFPDKTIEEVFDTLSPARQKLVTPIRPTDEEFRKEWESVKYESGNYREDTAVYITDRGERVRSKSEQLIANLLNRLGIPYRYEYPTTVMVDGQPRVWRPDFMILDVRNRREYYLEHFGRLGEAEYAKRAFDKMRIYEENGMYEGSNMIYTFEADEAPLDMRYVERKVRRVLGM